MKRSHVTREIVELVAILLVLFFIIRFVLQAYHLQGNNMRPGITTNAYVMVNKVAYLFSTPERGDAIVFHYPYDTNQDVMARVIGLPGDTVKTDNSHVWINGIPLTEPYVSTQSNPQAAEWKVPPNAYFVLNDNRQLGDDSRNWGALPGNFIVGKAIVVYWPLSNWQFINTYPAAFDAVKRLS